MIPIWMEDYKPDQDIASVSSHLEYVIPDIIHTTCFAVTFLTPLSTSANERGDGEKPSLLGFNVEYNRLMLGFDIHVHIDALMKYKQPTEEGRLVLTVIQDDMDHL